jgi:hypothetical protein
MKQNYEELKSFLRGYLNGAKMHRGLRALNIAVEWHDGTRKDKVTPEAIHQLSQIGSAINLVRDEDGLETLVCVIALHDIVEDKRYDIEWIRTEFGDEIASGVAAMSKKVFGRKVDKSTESYYYELGRNLFGSLAKGFDRKHNQSTCIGVLKPDRVLAMFADTETGVLPMLAEARKFFPHMSYAYTALRHDLKGQIHIAREAFNFGKLNSIEVTDV